MGRNSYAIEKFGVAVDALASGTDTIQDRLLNAFMSFHTINERDFAKPEDAAAYRSIKERLTSVKDGDTENGYVKNTLDQMSDDEASSLAADIVALDHSLRR